MEIYSNKDLGYLNKHFDNTNEDLIYLACDISTKSVLNNGGPFGCIITDYSNNIISQGHNMVTELNDPTAHAEIVAIRAACHKLKTFNLSNYKIFSSCEPCPMCLSSIYWAKINKVYYSNTRLDAKNIGFDDDFIYREIENGENKILKLKKINSSNSLDSFNIWKNKKDKISY